MIATFAKHSSLAKKTVAVILSLTAQSAYKEANSRFTLPVLGQLVIIQGRARLGRA